MTILFPHEWHQKYTVSAVTYTRGRELHKDVKPLATSSGQGKPMRLWLLINQAPYIKQCTLLYHKSYPEFDINPRVKSLRFRVREAPKLYNQDQEYCNSNSYKPVSTVPKLVVVKQT